MSRRLAMRWPRVAVKENSRPPRSRHRFTIPERPSADAWWASSMNKGRTQGDQQARLIRGRLHGHDRQVAQHVIVADRRQRVVERLGHLAAQLQGLATALLAGDLAKGIPRVNAVLGARLGAKRLHAF